MDGTDGVGGDDVGAGHDCPAPRPLEGGEGGLGKSRKQKAETGLQDHGTTGPRTTGRGMGAVRATEEEQVAIRAMLSKRAESAPAGAGVGRASVLAWAGLRLAAIVLVAAGVGVGLGDGNEFDDAGCSVALGPGGTSHGARSAQARESAGGKLTGSDGGSAGAAGGGSAGGAGDGGPYGGKAETRRQRAEGGKAETLKAEMLKAERRAGKGENGKGETFPIKLLKQVLDSTLEQQATIERILDDQALPERQRRPPLASETSQAVPPKPSEPDGPNLSLAAKVLELLTALDPDNRLRKAPPIKVFNLYYRQRLGAAEIARKCDCDRSLIYDRLAAIQQKVPWTPEQLREVSPHVEAMQDAVRDSRARRICRKGAAYGDEEDGGESDWI